MTLIKTFGVICLIVVSLLAGTAIGHAQAQAQRMLKPNNVVVLSGPDIGFRVDGVKESSVTGRFVVRISGKWVEVDNSFAPKLAIDAR